MPHVFWELCRKTEEILYELHCLVAFKKAFDILVYDMKSIYANINELNILDRCSISPSVPKQSETQCQWPQRLRVRWKCHKARDESEENQLDLTSKLSPSGGSNCPNIRLIRLLTCSLLSYWQKISASPRQHFQKNKPCIKCTFWNDIFRVSLLGMESKVWKELNQQKKKKEEENDSWFEQSSVMWQNDFLSLIKKMKNPFRVTSHSSRVCAREFS